MNQQSPGYHQTSYTLIKKNRQPRVFSLEQQQKRIRFQS
jgi:hypothetical protein